MSLDLINTGFVRFVADALDAGPADTPDERAAIYASLRNQVREQGVEGMSLDEALEELERNIARQDVFRGYFDDGADDVAGGADEGAHSAQTIEPSHGTRSLGSRVKSFFSRVPSTPPGPEPGPAVGPYSDHNYVSVTVLRAGNRAECRLSYRYDPACELQADMEAGDGWEPFQFNTRAWGFRYALAHLEQALAKEGMQLNCAGLLEGAQWVGDERESEQVRLPGSGTVIWALENQSPEDQSSED